MCVLRFFFPRPGQICPHTLSSRSAKHQYHLRFRTCLGSTLKLKDFLERQRCACWKRKRLLEPYSAISRAIPKRKTRCPELLSGGYWTIRFEREQQKSREWLMIWFQRS